MASKAFGSAKRPAGKKFRDGLVGEALDDLYSDIDEAFTAAEAGTLLGDAAISFGEDSAVIASPSTQIASYVVQHANADGNSTLDITVPYNCQILSFSLAVTSPTGDLDANTVTLNKIVGAVTTQVSTAASIRNLSANNRVEADIILTANALAAGDTLQISNVKADATNVDLNGYIAIIELVKVA